MERRNKLHLLWRSGFGPDIGIFSNLDSLSVSQLWEQIRLRSAKKLAPIIVESSFVQDNYDKITDRSLSPREKEDWNRRIRLQSGKDLKEMNNLWLDRMVAGENQLAEKMSFFWHHHFAIRHPNAFLQQDAVNIIRKYALGNFGDLLREVSKSGAMILSLNNQQNKKSSPNENFAREIMELFAMGIGNYTEGDIKEAARAFTGWSIGRDGRFTFRREQHDNGVKRVLGQSGNFDGDDIVDIILKQPQTSKFIVTKLYRFLVNETIDASRIDSLATSFRKDYDIMGLLNGIFTSDWFYGEQHVGSRIKTPIELLVGMRRLSPFAAIDQSMQLSLQKLLGQVLFHPPSIAGWPVGKNWIDSSTLMVRLQLPLVINGEVEVSVRAKENDDVDMGRTDRSEVQLRGRQSATANRNWQQWANGRDTKQLQSDLLVAVLPEDRWNILNKNINNKDRNSLAFGLMGLPEYQLC